MDRLQLRPSRRMAASRLSVSLACCLSLGVATGAWAQEAPTAAPAAEPAAAPAAAPAADNPDTAPAAVPAVGAGMTDYGVTEAGVPVGARMKWAERRELRVIQKREVLKQGRHAGSAFMGVIPNDDFFAYASGGLAYNYYFSEDIALEVRGAYTANVKTSLEESLTTPRPEGPGLQVRLPQTVVAHVSMAAVWNLVHGKIGVFDTGLTEFDLGLSFGIGAIMTYVTGQNDSGYSPLPQGNIGLTWQFYLSQQWAVRMDYRQFFFPKEGSGLSFPIAASIGLSYFTAPLD